jgi:lipopolysaccharide heptosyltransferase II
VKEIRQLYNRLRDEKYDLVVDLQGLLRSGLITMATRAPVRIGFAEAREGSRFFYTVKVKGGKKVHAVERYLKVASELGCNTDDIVFPFPLSAGSSEGVHGMGFPDDYAVLVPGARWKTKIWPAENFGEVAAKLPVRSVVIGSSADRGIAGQVVASSAGKALSVAGKTTLAELIGIIRNARLVITNDSGPMHIAAALNVPVIALFGPTSPVLTGPYGKGHIVLQSGEPCVPCFRKQCKDIICMKGISPADVIDEAMKMLKGSGT